MTINVEEITVTGVVQEAIRSLKKEGESFSVVVDFTPSGPLGSDAVILVEGKETGEVRVGRRLYGKQVEISIVVYTNTNQKSRGRNLANRIVNELKLYNLSLTGMRQLRDISNDRKGTELEMTALTFKTTMFNGVRLTNMESDIKW